MRLIYIILLFISVTSLEAKYKYSKYTYIPENAYEHLDTIRDEAIRLVPEMTHYYYYFPALIEHESCICIAPKRRCRRCFNAKSRLYSPREEGAGLTQITRTYHTFHGRRTRLRWDNLTRMKRKYPNELYELSWKNVYDRPDLQIRVGILLWKSNFDKLPKSINLDNRIKFADGMFNGGWGGIWKRRQVCKLKAGCNPNIWKDNVELICRRHKVIYGRRVCDIITHHVNDTQARMPKYKRYYKDIYEDVE